jgi:hypothetical protein
MEEKKEVLAPTESKESVQKDIQIFQQQAQIMNLQMQLLQVQYPQVDAKIKELVGKLRNIEVAEKFLQEKKEKDEREAAAKKEAEEKDLPDIHLVEGSGGGNTARPNPIE